MRDIKQLLEILLHEYKNNKVNMIQRSGLCWAISRLPGGWIISEKEANILKEYILSHKPETRFNGYWWPEGETAPRIEFLKQLIKIYE